MLLTLAAFALGTLINHKTGKAVFQPAAAGHGVCHRVFKRLRHPYASYKASASPVSYLLLPATVWRSPVRKWDLLRKMYLPSS